MNEHDRSDDIRLDKWLWAARFFKTRALAAAAVNGGKVTIAKSVRRGTTTFDGVLTTYATEGVYSSVLPARDGQGVVYTAPTVVSVEDPSVVMARFQVLWTSFKDRLRTGDIQGALNHLAPVLQPRWFKSGKRNKAHSSSQRRKVK